MSASVLPERSQGAPAAGRPMTPSKRTVHLSALAVLLLSVATRLSRAFAVFQGDEVVPLDGDSLRHLFRMEAAARDGLSVPSFDPWVNWPHGAFEPWAPGFDIVGALLMLPFGADTTGGKLAACLLPVLLGVAVVALTAKAAQRLELEGLPAWSAALVVAFAPQLVVSSLFGRTDHHVWEACTLLALAVWVLTPVKDRGVRHELAGAGLVFLAMWGFDGAPVYIALITSALAVGVLADPRPRLLGSGALALALGGLASSAAYVQVMLQHHVLWTFKRPSLLQPALVEVAALGLLLVVLACARAGIGLRRRVLALAVVGAGLLLAVAAVPPLLHQLATGLEEWLAKSDPWIASVSEFEPMLAAPHGFSRLRQSFGIWVWVAPVLFPLGLFLVARARGAKGAQWALLAAGTAGLSLLQMRFGRVAIPFVALTCVAALVEASRSWKSPRAWLLAPVACLAAVGLDARALAFLVPSEPEGQKPIVELSLALRALEPQHRGLGVLANWEDGHFVEALGRHPVLVNGFGSYSSPEGYELSRTYWSGSTEAMDSLFHERHLGWWIDGAQNFLGRKLGERSLFVEREGKPALEGRTVREWPLAASLFGGSGDVRRRVPHLAHFWPRAASTSATVDIGVKLPDLWLFEWVEGAVVEGLAAPQSVVSATLVLGERLPYTAWTLADAEGHYELRLPIPSGLTGAGLTTSPAWNLSVNDGTSMVAVNEREVREGTHFVH